MRKRAREVCTSCKVNMVCVHICKVHSNQDFLPSRRFNSIMWQDSGEVRPEDQIKPFDSSEGKQKLKYFWAYLDSRSPHFNLEGKHGGVLSSQKSPPNILHMAMWMMERKPACDCQCVHEPYGIFAVKKRRKEEEYWSPTTWFTILCLEETELDLWQTEVPFFGFCRDF